MALITDYDTLVAEVKAFMARTDATFSARFPMFVALAEDRIYNGHGQPGDQLYTPPVRVKQMETEATITITDGTGSLPDDVLAPRKVVRSSDQIGITYRAPRDFAVYLAGTQAGTPAYYTVEGTSLKIAPSWSGDITFSYFARLPAISADNKTGDLLTYYPMAYFNGVMFEAFSFLQDIDLAMAWLARYKATVDGINRTAAGIRTPGNIRRTIRAIG